MTTHAAADIVRRYKATVGRLASRSSGFASTSSPTQDASANHIWARPSGLTQQYVPVKKVGKGEDYRRAAA